MRCDRTQELLLCHKLTCTNTLMHSTRLHSGSQAPFEFVRWILHARTRLL